MTTTFATIPIVGRDVENLISRFTLTTMHARDIMVDRDGVFSFFYDPGTQVRKTGRRVEIRQTAPGIYRIDVGHIDPRTHEWIGDKTEHDVPAADLRAAVQNIT